MESDEVLDYDSDNSTVKFITSYSEPPLISDFHEETLKLIAETGKVPHEIYELPCHNQRVERAIKLVTETSQKCARKDEREGIIHTILASRREQPKCNSKKDFQMKIQLRET